MPRGADNTGRSLPGPRDSLGKKIHSPPSDKQWSWVTEDMLGSPAWRALSRPARMIVERLVVEHLRHSRKKNGNLKCLYDHFVEYGIRRASIGLAIAHAQRLGWIDVIATGKHYGAVDTTSLYRLAWLDDNYTGARATARWRRFATLEQAERAILEATAAWRARPAIKASSKRMKRHHAKVAEARKIIAESERLENLGARLESARPRMIDRLAA